MKHHLLRPAMLAAFICLGLMIIGMWVRPIFPVDETRYLTVAWEMHQSGNWILPTLNAEAYHHKPPVLFWLINILWLVFGVSQQAAMAAPFIAAFSVLVLTARLASRIYPHSPDAPLVSVVILGGCLPFVIYSNLIMFDVLLTVSVLLAVTALWDFVKTRKNIHIGLFAFAIGLGLLSKGPAILLHIAPALLLVRIWAGSDNSPVKSWLPKIIGGLVIGIALALCWAIPAAIEGGKEFTEKIFYGQTTGRMVNAFDHKRPIFWYLTFVPLFVMPWIFSPALWSGLKSLWKNNTRITKFLLLWIGLVFAAFSFISGKQVHYLLPLLPPMALLFSGAFLERDTPFRRRDIWPIIGGTAVLALIPAIVHLFATEIAALQPNSVHITDAFGRMNPWPSITIAAVMLSTGLVTWRTERKYNLTIITVSMVMMMGAFQIAASEGFYKNYDLAPLGGEIHALEGRPLAFAKNDQGQFGFLARLQKPLEEITEGDIDTWIRTHPDGAVVTYTTKPEKWSHLRVIYTAPFRMTNTLLLMEAPKDRPSANAGN